MRDGAGHARIDGAGVASETDARRQVSPYAIAKTSREAKGGWDVVRRGDLRALGVDGRRRGICEGVAVCEERAVDLDVTLRPRRITVLAKRCRLRRQHYKQDEWPLPAGVEHHRFRANVERAGGVTSLPASPIAGNPSDTGSEWKTPMLPLSSMP